VVVHILIPATQETEVEDLGLRQKRETLYEKQTKAKRAGGMAQLAELLPSKFIVLSSNPRTTPPPKK
jgi:hypothetical protein